MAKQRRNRERATELMTLLEELVPPNHPFRKKEDGRERDMPKRSRNKVLEDTIAAVSKAVMQDIVKATPLPFPVPLQLGPERPRFPKGRVGHVLLWREPWCA